MKSLICIFLVFLQLDLAAGIDACRIEYIRSSIKTKSPDKDFQASILRSYNLSFTKMRFLNQKSQKILSKQLHESLLAGEKKKSEELLFQIFAELRNQVANESPGSLRFKTRALIDSFSSLRQQWRSEATKDILPRSIATIRELFQLALISSHGISVKNLKIMERELNLIATELGLIKTHSAYSKDSIFFMPFNFLFDALNRIIRSSIMLRTDLQAGEQIIISNIYIKSITRAITDHMALLTRLGYASILIYVIANPIQTYHSLKEGTKYLDIEFLVGFYNNAKNLDQKKVHHNESLIQQEYRILHEDLVSISKTRELTKEEKSRLELAQTILNLKIETK
ncbi:MAG: hypothetical protein AB8E15_10405 [Bdellovibrionales bacterium]